MKYLSALAAAGLLTSACGATLADNGGGPGTRSAVVVDSSGAELGPVIGYDEITVFALYRIRQGGILVRLRNVSRSGITGLGIKQAGSVVYLTDDCTGPVFATGVNINPTFGISPQPILIEPVESTGARVRILQPFGTAARRNVGSQSADGQCVQLRRDVPDEDGQFGRIAFATRELGAFPFIEPFRVR